MADSGRKQIMDRVLALLKTITLANGYNTQVKKVDETARSYVEIPLKFIPYLQPMDTDEERETIAMPIGASYGQQGILELTVACVVYDSKNRTRTKRLNLMQDVEKAIMNDATLLALLTDIEPTGVETDDNSIKNYSIWDQTFDLTYVYDRDDGG